MLETTNMTKTGALATVRTGHTAWSSGGDGSSRDGRGVRARGEYYRAYYHALVEGHAGRSKGRRGIEDIKQRRRRQARRGNWLQSIKSLTGVMHATLS